MIYLKSNDYKKLKTVNWKFEISSAFIWSEIDSDPTDRHFNDEKKQPYSQSVAFIKKIFLPIKKVVFGIHGSFKKKQ